MALTWEGPLRRATSLPFSLIYVFPVQAMAWLAHVPTSSFRFCTFGEGAVDAISAISNGSLSCVRCGIFLCLAPDDAVASEFVDGFHKPSGFPHPEAFGHIRITI